MFDRELFFGFPLDPIYIKKLEKINPYLYSQFIGDSEEYLKEVNAEGLRYLGKNLGKITSIAKLELIEANIYSLLERLVPDYPYNETSLYLFSLKSHE